MALFFLALIGNIGVGQNPGRYTLSGRIIDAGTHEPLPFVNVFLAGSALGAVSDTAGRFTISRIPTGVYELIISTPGYVRVIRRVEIQERDLTSYRIALKEKVIEEAPVDIVGEEPSVWKDRLKTFRSRFFGTTRNGAKCRIMNPEVLEFTVDESTGRFEATSSSPLIIENRALGYRIDFIFRYFIIDDRAVKISGWPRFEELDSVHAGERSAWEAERVRAYDGSLRHFLAALVNGTFKEEGFRISLVRGITSSSQMSLVPETELREQIVKLGPLSFERQLSFEDYLKVEYLHEYQEKGFEEYWERILGWGRTYSDRHQFSWLRLSLRPAMLTADGMPYDSSILETYGYWAYERVGEWLPLEYRP